MQSTKKKKEKDNRNTPDQKAILLQAAQGFYPNGY